MVLRSCILLLAKIANISNTGDHVFYIFKKHVDNFILRYVYWPFKERKGSFAIMQQLNIKT